MRSRFLAKNCSRDVMSCSQEGNMRYLHTPKRTPSFICMKSLFITEILIQVLWPQIVEMFKCEYNFFPSPNMSETTQYLNNHT